MSEMQTFVVFVTAGSEEDAATIGRAVVEERLAACANVVPRIRSIYRWQGKVEDEPEALMFLKTSQENLSRLIDRVKALHGYEVPDIIAFPIHRGYPPYLDWIRENA